MEPSSRRMLLQFWIIQFLGSFGNFLHRSEISSIICKKRMFPNQVNQNYQFITILAIQFSGYHCQITNWLPVGSTKKPMLSCQDPTIGSKQRSTLAHCKATGLGRQCHTTITKVTPAWKQNKSCAKGHQRHAKWWKWCCRIWKICKICWFVEHKNCPKRNCFFHSTTVSNLERSPETSVTVSIILREEEKGMVSTRRYL